MWCSSFLLLVFSKWSFFVQMELQLLDACSNQRTRTMHRPLPASFVLRHSCYGEVCHPQKHQVPNRICKLSFQIIKKIKFIIILYYFNLNY